MSPSTCTISTDELVVLLFSFEEKFIATPKSQIFYMDLIWNVFLSSCEMYVCVKLKNDWFFGAIIFYPAGWGRMVVIYFVQLFWCFSISCVDLFTGKAAILEIETKSYNAESGELLCMNRWVLPETSHSNVVMSYAFYWKNEEKGPAILLTREG